MVTRASHDNTFSRESESKSDKRIADRKKQKWEILNESKSSSRVRKVLRDNEGSPWNKHLNAITGKSKQSWFVSIRQCYVILTRSVVSWHHTNFNKAALVQNSPYNLYIMLAPSNQEVKMTVMMMMMMMMICDQWPVAVLQMRCSKKCPPSLYHEIRKHFLD